MKKIIMSLAVAAAVAGCASNHAEKNPLAGKNFATVQENTRITLNFDEKDMRLYGKVVNNYHAPYELAGDNIIVGRMASTMMAPVGPSAQIEQDYFKFMSDPDPKHYKLKSGTLTITDHAGKSYSFEKMN